MKKYNLHREQILESSLDKVWAFFSSPENLDTLTPDNMGFEILTPQPIKSMFQGQIIDYKVSPLLNIPLRWRTLITEVRDKEYFVDEQVKGPYAYWRHKHTFEAVSDHKTRMTDDLEYALPLGFLGSIAHSLYVRNRLKEIFDYRFEKVELMFNGKASERISNADKAFRVERSPAH